MQEHANIGDHVKALSQKYMGSRPQVNTVEDIFRTQPIEADSEHPVPITNFLNAQCKSTTRPMSLRRHLACA